MKLNSFYLMLLLICFGCISNKQSKSTPNKSKYEYIIASYNCKINTNNSIVSKIKITENFCDIFKEELNDSTKVSLHLSGSLEYGVLLQTQGFYHLLDKDNKKKSEMKRLDFIYIPFLDAKDKKNSDQTSKDFLLREIKFSFPDYDKIPQLDVQVSILIN